MRKRAPLEVETGSKEDLAIQLTEGWILGCSPTATPEPNERTPEYLTKLLPVEIERCRAPIRASGVLIE
jgi:hypothetical protein